MSVGHLAHCGSISRKGKAPVLKAMTGVEKTGHTNPQRLRGKEERLGKHRKGQEIMSREILPEGK